MDEYVQSSSLCKSPGISFDCWLMSSGSILDTLQDEKNTCYTNLLNQCEVLYVV